MMLAMARLDALHISQAHSPHRILGERNLEGLITDHWPSVNLCLAFIYSLSVVVRKAED